MSQYEVTKKRKNIPVYKTYLEKVYSQLKSFITLNQLMFNYLKKIKTVKFLLK